LCPRASCLLFRIDFEGASVEIEKGSPNLQDIHLAYALTIHKTHHPHCAPAQAVCCSGLFVLFKKMERNVFLSST
jgi:DNA polymerase III epsilon subunit-like protein